MKVGDLVKVKNPWTALNDWMEFDEEGKIGLLLRFSGSKISPYWWVLINGEEHSHHQGTLEVINESR